MSIAVIEIDGGICRHLTTARMTCDDGQMVSLDMGTDCANIQKLTDILVAHAPIDAFAELKPGGNVIAQSARDAKSVCAGCVVPAALAKGMQVSAGLALARNPTVNIRKE